MAQANTGFFRGYTLTLLTVCWLAGCAAQPSGVNLAHGQAPASEVPLMTAIAQGQTDQVKQLVRKGEAVNTLTELGTPLAYAVAQGEDRIVWYLLSQGATADASGPAGETPLMVAAGKGERRLAQLLLSAGANVNASSAFGSTPVIRAASAGHLSMVKLLLTAGANVNVSQNGRSLLMHIVAGGDLLTTETLLTAGADVNARAADGTTALTLAQAGNEPDIVMLLLQAGAD